MKDDTTAEKHPGTRKLPGCFHCTAVRCTSCRRHIMPKAHHAEGTSCRRHIMPKAHHAEGTSCRRHIMPKAHHAEGTSCRRHIMPKAHHAEGTSCRRHIMPKAHHLRSNIIFTLPRPHSLPSGRPARRSSCTGRRIRSRPPARPRTPHAASASGAWRLPGCRSGRCALCHS